ncbi:MAG: hypothetical protein V1720_21265 [bacterium]
MFDLLKQKIAKLLLHHKVKSIERASQPYNKFISRSLDYLIIMPKNEQDFKNGLSVLEYFIHHKKNISVFIPDVKFNFIPHKSGLNIIDFSLDDITKLNMPGKGLQQRLKNRTCDVLIDLNLEDEVFYDAVVLMVESKYKIGFEKPDSDRYYNFQVPKSENNSDFSYRNLLNSLKMF